MECWNPVLNRDVAEQKRILQSDNFRTAFKEALKRPLIFSSRWEVMTILEVQNKSLEHLIGMNIAEIAAKEGEDPVDMFLDLAIRDELAMQFNYELFNSNEALIP